MVHPDGVTYAMATALPPAVRPDVEVYEFPAPMIATPLSAEMINLGTLSPVELGTVGTIEVCHTASLQGIYCLNEVWAHLSI